MRASSRLSPSQRAAWSLFIWRRRAWPSASLWRVMKVALGGGKSDGMGLGEEALITVPWWTTGRKPEEKLPRLLYGRPRGSGSTTNVGKSSVMLPRPYDSHAPRQGKPGRTKPVFIM